MHDKTVHAKYLIILLASFIDSVKRKKLYETSISVFPELKTTKVEVNWRTWSFRAAAQGIDHFPSSLATRASFV
jgi:hypothetical protein